ncbi:MAG: hypothetical protein LRY66_14870 [Saccharospirillaceae bacterium]|nr:hypothetical protein [Saccharospirillaceae bacterium]MCD8532590.1 hypothetical protein [Saccharospirillaceae bacterium]
MKQRTSESAEIRRADAFPDGKSVSSAEEMAGAVDTRTDGRHYEVQPQRHGARWRVCYREGTTPRSACRLCR